MQTHTKESRQSTSNSSISADFGLFHLSLNCKGKTQRVQQQILLTYQAQSVAWGPLQLGGRRCKLLKLMQLETLRLLQLHERLLLRLDLLLLRAWLQ